MRFWFISKTPRGYFVHLITPMSDEIQTRCDSMEEAEEYVKRHGGSIAW